MRAVLPVRVEREVGEDAHGAVFYHFLRFHLVEEDSRERMGEDYSVVCIGIYKPCELVRHGIFEEIQAFFVRFSLLREGVADFIRVFCLFGDE